MMFVPLLKQSATGGFHSRTHRKLNESVAEVVLGDLVPLDVDILHRAVLLEGVLQLGLQRERRERSFI